MIFQPPSVHVAIACGGTGGHLFPGVAVGNELVRLGHEVTLLVSPKDVDQHAVRCLTDLKIETLPAVGLQEGRRLAFLRGFWQSRQAARRLFDRHRPRAVLGMGGFTSAPPILAGRRVGAATFVHESNVIPGRANRWIAHVVDQCFVGFPETAARLWNPRVSHTGTPVRDSFQPMDAAAARISLGLDPRRPVLLIMGGSQGATGLNELFLKALPQIVSAVQDLQFIHLTGTLGLETARKSHALAGVRSVVVPFLTEMELALCAATLAVSRAGASSLAELAALHVPAILIPYPAATDRHQHFNAAAVARNGAAEVLDQGQTSAGQFTHAVLRILTNPVRRDVMARAMASQFEPRAAGSIARELLSLTMLISVQNKSEDYPAVSFTEPEQRKTVEIL
ncbi:MAG: UDP-N-acetylglucosamine--N-acetylmuramyl-(pentapeptide) pyrophosphoryl-undecaprenol N-acetylglucosamine transferase [Pedosphaera sp.]|nr:UDP-N-acetylglucosamine--N-acetylmuramyl-(pentapeptide) pyrophosphoryl-undecaprenol N-acetylglucosamine transferase [Pedosphaera sp.]